MKTHGLLCAIISGPNLLPISLWLNTIFGDEKAFHSMKEINSVASAIIRLNHQINRTLIEDKLFIPLVDYQVNSPENFVLTEKQTQHLELWCHGYLIGIALDMNGWCDAESESLTSLVVPMVTIASIRKHHLKNSDTPEKTVDTDEESRSFLDKAISVIPKVIPAIFNFWQYKSKSLHHKTFQSISGIYDV